MELSVMVALPVRGRRCLATVQHDASQYGKTQFAIVLKPTMGDFTHDAGGRRAVHSSSLEESILNIEADKPYLSSRAFAHHVKCESSDRL
ncbi:hypothetical protein TNCV_3477161 [Trichonephila clavipes]|nr:hypothetical protein TNCV_3477161 [Trichonephila clavipes]